MGVKDAFVTSLPTAVKEATLELIAEIAEVDMTLVKGDAHQYWMQQLDALSTHTKNISDLEEIEAQRRQFDFLSQAMIHTIKAFGAAGADLYVQHCPMAFDNEGADWISNEEAIRNPYFGDRMLKCGSVLEVLTD